MDNYIINIEGLDRSGKDTLVSYIHRQTNFKYVLHPRSVLTNLVYNKMFSRPYVYDLEQYRDQVFVILDTDFEDWIVRCRNTGEKPNEGSATLEDQYHRDSSAFEEQINFLIKEGFKVIRFNTSIQTPYMIAKQVVAYMESLE